MGHVYSLSGSNGVLQILDNIVTRFPLAKTVLTRLSIALTGVPEIDLVEMLSEGCTFGLANSYNGDSIYEVRKL